MQACTSAWIIQHQKKTTTTKCISLSQADAGAVHVCVSPAVMGFAQNVISSMSEVGDVGEHHGGEDAPSALIQTSVVPMCLGRRTWPLKENVLRGLTQGRQTKLAGMIRMLRAKHSCSMDRGLATSSYICRSNVGQHSPPLHSQQCSNINPVETETSQNERS